MTQVSSDEGMKAWMGAAGAVIGKIWLQVVGRSKVSIDWDFIRGLEGGQRLSGYVPWKEGDKNNNSGVTIATGFDIGANNKQDLQNLGLPESLIDKLAPYTGKHKAEAKKYLKAHPLTITSYEAGLIDRNVKASILDKFLIPGYDQASPNVKFVDLPPQAQTVIASLRFQYGNLPASNPQFWKLVTQQKWKETVAWLRNRNEYKPRRNAEADLLEQIVNAKRE